MGKVFSMLVYDILDGYAFREDSLAVGMWHDSSRKVEFLNPSIRMPFDGDWL